MEKTLTSLRQHCGRCGRSNKQMIRMEPWRNNPLLPVTAAGAPRLQGGVACSSRLASPTSATTVTPVVTVNAASSPQAGSSVFANASDWRLTTVLTSVVGASGCQFPGSPPVGQSVLWELSVGRSDHTV